jgi:hypothetical protein
MSSCKPSKAGHRLRLLSKAGIPGGAVGESVPATGANGSASPLGAQQGVHLHGARLVGNKQAVAQKTLSLEPKPLREAGGADVLRFDFGLDAVGVESGEAVG